MAKDFNATIHGKETLSQAADQAVKGLNRLRAQLQAVANTAKFFAGGAIGFQFLRFFSDSVDAYRKSEEAAVKMGRAMATPAVALTNLNKAFGELKVAAGESFASEARPVIEWLARVASDSARAQREITGAKNALNALAAGNETVNAADAMLGLALRAAEVQRALQAVQGRPGTGAATAALREQATALDEQIRRQAEAARWMAAGAAAGSDMAETLKLLGQLYPKTTESTREATLATIELLERGFSKLSDTEDLEHLHAVLRMLYSDLEKLNKPKKVEIKIDFPMQEEGDPAQWINLLRFRTKEATAATEDYWSAWGQGASNFEGIGKQIVENMEEQTKKILEQREAIMLFGDLASGVFAGIGESLMEGTAEGFADAFKSMFIRLLGMLATYSWAQVAASLFPVLGLPNPVAAANWTAAALGASVAAGAISAMAQGGVLWEPMMGVGLRTGQRYLMGERGPETITPGLISGGGGGGGNHFHRHYHVAGSLVREREMLDGVMAYQDREMRSS